MIDIISISSILFALFVIILNLPVLERAQAFLSISGEEDLGGHLTSRPNASVESDKLDVFFQGSDGILGDVLYDSLGSCHCWYSADLGKISPFDSTGASSVSCSGLVDRVDVFYEGDDSHLWHFGWDRHNPPAPSKDLGDGLGTPPEVACGHDVNHYDIYYGGTNGHIWRTTWAAQNNWVPVKQDLGGAAQFEIHGPVSTPSVLTQNSGVIDVFFTAPPPCAFGCIPLGAPTVTLPWNLWKMELKEGSPATFTDLGGRLLSAPNAVSHFGVHHEIDIFYRGVNNHLWHKLLDAAGNTIQPDEDLGGHLDTRPYAVYYYLGGERYDIFYESTDPDHHLVHRIAYEKCPSIIIPCPTP